ncbi:MAG: ATP-dependent DNA helicase [Patescibacteria group bacterium]
MSKSAEMKGGEAAFKEAYASLNAAQKQAVDTIEGPVMVIAGPGTGKTQILTLRIANILRTTDVEPENILALTFTEAGAVAMRNRLRRYLGSAAYRVPIYTFHGFANVLIKQYPDAYPTIIGGQPLTDLERIGLLTGILESAEIKKLRPTGNPDFYLGPLTNALQTLKREAISPADLAAYNQTLQQQLEATEQYHEKGAHKGKVRGEYTKLESLLQKNQELHFVYQAYQAALQADRKFDFEDMLLETIAALKSNESMLRDLQETYQYLLADEHQDVNGSQNTILELLADFHETPNVFVVGDEKQAIYRFQGASLENFLYFEDRFKGAVTISLTENYRSTQQILDAAHELIAEPEHEVLSKLRLPLTANTKEKGELTLHDFSHQGVEDEWLVEMVQNSLKNHSPEEIAVIVRSNREVEAIAAKLRQAGVPTNASAEGDILVHPITTQIRSLVRTLTHPEDEEALFRVLHSSVSGLSLKELAELLSARSHGQSLWELAADTDIVGVLEEIKQSVSNQPPHRAIALLLQKTGLQERLIAELPHEAARVIRRLLDEVEQMVVHNPTITLHDVSNNFTEHITHHLPLTAPYISTTESAVQVMTAHKAKGLEFAVVIAPHLTDNRWGSKKAPEYFSLPVTRLTEEVTTINEDERRLLYVLLTRAKTELHLSYATTSIEGKDLMASRLLEKVVPGATEELTKEFEQSVSLLSTVEEDSELLLTPEVLTALLQARGFSATSYNNYLASPYTYLYRNILRMPEVRALPLLFGTGVHDVMEVITKTHSNEGRFVVASELNDLLTRSLRRLPLSNKEYSQLHERGLTALSVYLEYFTKTAPTKTLEELAVNVVLQTGIPELPELPLSGKLDRLDFDSEGKVLRVVDYKTGAPKTRNVIEGKTKTSDGGYKRQLVFYALLLKLYDKESYTTREGVLSFVEPDKHGVVHEESFTITDKEIQELQEGLIAAAQDFISGNFLQSPCDPATSDYCDLVEQLKNRLG